MSKNKEGIFRAVHNEVLQQTAEYYCAMCELADFPKVDLISFFYNTLKGGAIADILKISNPNRLRDNQPIKAPEKRLYSLFVAYCLIDFITEIDPQGELDEYAAIAEYAISFIDAQSGNDFGNSPELYNFRTFIETAFSSRYDAKMHSKIKGLVIYKGWANADRVAVKSPQVCYPVLLDANSQPYVLPKRVYKHKEKK